MHQPEQKPPHYYLLERLAYRGWSEGELRHAHHILNQHTTKTSWLEVAVLWIIFFHVIIGNAIIAALFIPLLLVFPNTAIYGIAIIMGASFGFLIEEIIRHLGHHFYMYHRLFMGLIIPLIAIVSIMLVTNYTIAIMPLFIDTVRHPVIIGLLYGGAFIFPYLISLVVHRFFAK